MRNICTGCGNEIPPDQDFCYVCGTWADKGLKINDEATILYSPKCLECGKDLPADAEFCPFCGAPSDKSQVPITVGSRTSSFVRILSIILAVVPGFFNIFGLGQIVQRRWAKAFTFICITVLLLYLAPSMMSTSNGRMVLTFIQLGVFFFSLMDVFRGNYRRD
jgi:RNA polymerase subunit RPABC4/transcription elongation factor Spt4